MTETSLAGYHSCPSHYLEVGLEPHRLLYPPPPPARMLPDQDVARVLVCACVGGGDEKDVLLSKQNQPGLCLHPVVVSPMCTHRVAVDD